MPAEDLLCERWLVRCPAPADLVRRRPVLREEAILMRDDRGGRQEDGRGEERTGNHHGDRNQEVLQMIFPMCRHDQFLRSQ